ncbi:MAG: AbrB/MazE/SpoVT family DNA-binding domain-containing protein [Candidatus Pacearchaeota archaeon]|nr:AbrB/MazE/SpoVT family DNA-binding domain-containing protein [Candidatus Pacearchaeota archaeon]
MESLTTTRKIGGSLVVTLPKKIVESQSIQEGELIKIIIEKIKKSAFGVLKGMRSFSKEDKFIGQLG